MELSDEFLRFKTYLQSHNIELKEIVLDSSKSVWEFGAKSIGKDTPYVEPLYVFGVAVRSQPEVGAEMPEYPPEELLRFSVEDFKEFSELDDYVQESVVRFIKKVI